VGTGQKTRPILSTRHFFKRMHSILGRALGDKTFKVEEASATLGRLATTLMTGGGGRLAPILMTGGGGEACVPPSKRRS